MTRRPRIGITVGDPATVTDQSNYFWRSAMDHIGDSEGNEHAGRVDLEYTFQDSDWLQFVRFGARLADRSYRNLSTGWNWGVISDDWNKLTGAPADPARANVAWLDQFYSSESTLYTMNDFFGGKANVPTSFWSPKDSMVDIATELLALAEERLRIGIGSEFEIVSARASLEGYRDSLRQIELSLEQSIRALELLVGRYPAAALVPANALIVLPASVPPAGLPSELLERRPDLLAAEQRVAAAFNRVQEAEAARRSQESRLAASIRNMTELADAGVVDVAALASANLTSGLVSLRRDRAAE